MKRLVISIRDWTLTHLNRLHDIRAKPEAVAGGMAIGMFLGFTPFVGIKTLTSIVVAYICRCSMVAAAVAVTLHDLFLPIAPLLIRWEYDLGYWILSHPHQFPPHIRMHQLTFEAMFNWNFFFDIGRPLLVGSTVFGAVAAVVTYCATHIFLLRRRAYLTAHERDKHDQHPDV